MRYWVFTSKPSHFKLEDALQPGETLDWPTFSRFKFEVGDLVFIYASNPVMQLVGKLEIERNDLDFLEVDPLNDLRKWPRLYSKIPWLRLRVLQRAPIPFKPLQRRSLYYYAEFKPSPYPKLLHDGEIDYVLRAFDEAELYSRETRDDSRLLSERALARIINGEVLSRVADRLAGAEVTDLTYSQASDSIEVTLRLPGIDAENLRLKFSRIERIVWTHDKGEETMIGLRLTVEDTFLLANFDGSGLEILALNIEVTR